MGKVFWPVICLLWTVLGVSCNTNQVIPDPSTGEPRVFSTSFEAVQDFSGFFLVPQGDYDSFHELSREVVRTGSFAHKAWVLKARESHNDGAVYLPHRAYPTVQFHKTPQGSFRTPCLVTFWASLDMELQDKPAGQIDDWFSFATLSPDSSDNWARTVLVNLTPDGYLRLVHVPDQGEQKYQYQVSAAADPQGLLLYPQKEWVRIDIYIDFSPSAGEARAWQNGQLVSRAEVKGGNGTLAQAHFGLYASAAVPTGTIYNDDLVIREVSGVEEALGLVETAFLNN